MDEEQTQLQTQTQTQTYVPDNEEEDRQILMKLLDMHTEVPEKSEGYIPRPSAFSIVAEEGSLFVGRGPDCAIRLNAKNISQHHAEIFVRRDEQSGQFLAYIKDMSSNGTYRNKERLKKGHMVLLDAGDELIFGIPQGAGKFDFRYGVQVAKAFQKTKALSFANYASSEASFSSGTTGNTSMPAMEPPEISKYYDIREQIGKGSFAAVFRAIEYSTGDVVAIKRIDKSRFNGNPQTLDMIRREVSIMKQVDHPYCVGYKGFYEDDTKIYIILELIKGGDLLEYTMNSRGLSEDVARPLIKMVLEALAYLHDKNIVHRDVKPENVLLKENPSGSYTAKVADFGMAKTLSGGTALRTMCGTPSYLAPEVILSPHGAYGPEVDSWSIGVVTYSLLTNCIPFEEDERLSLKERMESRVVDYPLLYEMRISLTAIDFISKLLTNDPSRRMTAKEALSHDWITGRGSHAGPLGVPKVPLSRLERPESSVGGTEFQKLNISDSRNLVQLGTIRPRDGSDTTIRPAKTGRHD